MLPEHRVLLEDERCPVADQMLGKIYRASAAWAERAHCAGLANRQGSCSPCIATVEPTLIRSTAIAVTCEKDELTGLGGNAGAILFKRSRELAKSPSNAPANGRRKITLATGALRQLSLIEDEEDLGIRTNRIWHGCSLRAGESERYQNGRW